MYSRIFRIGGINRHRVTVYRWVQKIDLPTDSADPNQVSVDETVIQLDSERYCLYTVRRVFR